MGSKLDRVQTDGGIDGVGELDRARPVRSDRRRPRQRGWISRHRRRCSDQQPRARSRRAKQSDKQTANHNGPRSL
jgi:hypothetical protein